MSSASPAYGATQRPFHRLLFSGPRPEPLRVSRSVGKASRSCVGPISSCSQTTPVQRRLGSPRSPRCCRRNLLKGGRRAFFAGQLPVDNASSCCTSKRTHEAHAISRLAIVESENLLVQIAKQMERFDPDIGAFQSALEARPEILDPIYVHEALRVFSPHGRSRCGRIRG
jgi:hypothetical protein